MPPSDTISYTNSACARPLEGRLLSLLSMLTIKGSLCRNSSHSFSSVTGLPSRVSLVNGVSPSCAAYSVRVGPDVGVRVWSASGVGVGRSWVFELSSLSLLVVGVRVWSASGVAVEFGAGVPFLVYCLGQSLGWWTSAGSGQKCQNQDKKPYFHFWWAPRALMGRKFLLRYGLNVPKHRAEISQRLGLGRLVGIQPQEVRNGKVTETR